MQVSSRSSNSISNVLDGFLSRFLWGKPELNSFTDPDYLRISSSISELKEMVDFLFDRLTFQDLNPPKRNSKISLASWIANVVLSVCEAEENSKAVAPTEVSELEVLAPETFDIVLFDDDRCTEEYKTTQAPPFLIHAHKLFERTRSTLDLHYFEIPSQHLSDISEEHGQPIALTTHDLVAFAANIHGNPPRFIIHKNGAYKRITWGVIGLGSTVKYAQVIAESLSNIVVVP
jgi:hypothetical protein